MRIVTKKRRDGEKSKYSKTGGQKYPTEWRSSSSSSISSESARDLLVGVAGMLSPSLLLLLFLPPLAGCFFSGRGLEMWSSRSDENLRPRHQQRRLPRRPGGCRQHPITRPVFTWRRLNFFGLVCSERAQRSCLPRAAAAAERDGGTNEMKREREKERENAGTDRVECAHW